MDYDHLVTGEVSAIRENGATSGVGVLATYAYDNLGRRTGITRGNGTSTSYGYDSVSRLSSLSQDMAGSSYDFTHSFSYNPASQIASLTRSNDGYAWAGHANVNRNYSVNGLNQTTAAGATSLTHDARGNTSAIGGSGYGYGQLNQMTSFPGGTLYYDSVGRLALIDHTSAARSLDYDGANLVAEYNYNSGAMLRRYVPGPGTDEPLVWYEGSGTSDRRWLHADERGSIVAVSNASGTVTNVNTYNEYGVPGAGNVGRFQYTGQAWLPELGMYYYKARIYNPTLGRFMQSDPIGYGDGMNVYNYVGGDPVNLVDPFGLKQDKDKKPPPPVGPPDGTITGRRIPREPSCSPANGCRTANPESIRTKPATLTRDGVEVPNDIGCDTSEDGCEVEVTSQKEEKPKPKKEPLAMSRSACTAAVGGVLIAGTVELGTTALHVARSGYGLHAVFAGATSVVTLKLVGIAVVSGAIVYVADRVTDGAISNFAGKQLGICR